MQHHEKGSTVVHVGMPILMQHRDGSVTVMCHLRHVLATVKSDEWAHSFWESRSTRPVECRGALPSLREGLSE